MHLFNILQYILLTVLCFLTDIILRVTPQGSSQRRQSAAQASGPAGHGAAAQAVALQAPRQPLPHQDREDPAGARLANDPGPGESTFWPHPSRCRSVDEDEMKL